LARCSRQARRPVSVLAAGIDAASMARRGQKQLKKMRMSFSTRRGARAAGWAGACFAGGCATSLGIGGPYTKAPGEIGKRCADESSPNAQGIAAVQARFRWPHAEETSPCPPCRRQGSGQREAEDTNRSGRHQPKRKTPTEAEDTNRTGRHQPKRQAPTTRPACLPCATAGGHGPSPFRPPRAPAPAWRTRRTARGRCSRIPAGRTRPAAARAAPATRSVRPR